MTPRDGWLAAHIAAEFVALGAAPIAMLAIFAAYLALSGYRALYRKRPGDAPTALGSVGITAWVTYYKIRFRSGSPVALSETESKIA